MCDNENQGIVPVPGKLGNGKDPENNLYWGAAYGVKTYFGRKNSEWKFLKKFQPENSSVLRRLLFKHKTENVYLLADAYDGEQIKKCIEIYLKSSNGQLPVKIHYDSLSLGFGGESDLVAYIGHDGLMDFNVNVNYNPVLQKKTDAIVLACFSKNYFYSDLQKSKANPILWTTHLMAPEAYILEAALSGWIRRESNQDVRERAALAYHKYQKCGIGPARKLFTTGF